MVRQRRRVPLAYLGVADARGVAVLEQLFRQMLRWREISQLLQSRQETFDFFNPEGVPSTLLLLYIFFCYVNVLKS